MGRRVSRARTLPTARRSLVRDSRGFSLLELMVVLVIVALLFSFTTLTIQTDDPVQQIREEALRFDRLLDLLLDEAVMRGEDLGIAIQPRGYQFLRFNEDGWTPITDDRILREREMPGDIELDLAIEQTDIVFGGDSEDDELKPQVFVLSSGEITPDFDVAFYIPAITRRYIVRASFDGQHAAAAED